MVLDGPPPDDGSDDDRRDRSEDNRRDRSDDDRRDRSEDNRSDESEDNRRDDSEPTTDRIPRYTDDSLSGEVYDVDDVDYTAIVSNQAGVGFDRVDLITTREPSQLARHYLFPTEKFRGEWRRHWIHLASRLTVGVVATFVLGYLSGYFARAQQPTALTILIVIWLVVMSWVLWDVAQWYFDRFLLTNKRVMLIEGIVARKVAMMPLNRVTDMKYTQSPLGRVLGYGTFELESAGQEQALRTIKNLPHPSDLYLQVVEEMYEPEASEARRRPAEVDGT
jgi:membrane protein YdbS with pleckstrin-like domain